MNQVSNIQQVKNKILPFFDEFVDTLDQFSEFMDKKCENSLDKKVMLMFMMTYMFSHNSIDESLDKKTKIKLIMSELIKCPEKRVELINMFVLFEKKLNLVTEECTGTELGTRLIKE